MIVRTIDAKKMLADNRIPISREFAKELKLKQGTPLIVSIENGALIIKPSNLREAKKVNPSFRPFKPYKKHKKLSVQ